MAEVVAARTLGGRLVPVAGKVGPAPDNIVYLFRIDCNSVIVILLDAMENRFAMIAFQGYLCMNIYS